MIDSIYNSEAYQAAKKMMDNTEMKHKVYATNMANIETPGYKRIDVDKAFETKLNTAIQSGDVKTLSALQPKFIKDTKTPQVRADGNNVELDRELLNIKENALQHELSAKILSSSLNRLKLAIKGRQ